jgi:putative oxidoreductase
MKGTTSLSWHRNPVYPKEINAESIMKQSILNAGTQLTGRVLMSAIFILAGINKITGYAGTQGYMESMGVPGVLLPLVILLEVGGGLAILAGWQTRITAFLLAGFCVVSAVIFHASFSDQMQSILFMKNLAMAGGLLFLVAGETHGWSIDARREARA